MGICSSSSSNRHRHRRRKPQSHHRRNSRYLGFIDLLPFVEKAQMVCGSCRRLLSYLRGSKHVKCSSCQTVNLVLEASQVGQVNCNNCKLLLMYPYGAPSVRCSSCNSITDIREENKRPPWSEQQGPLKSLSNVR
ncbi:Zinc finger LSD1-type [Arabidopsis thaliana x Arabidopsis arenosa]|uniref:Zinc finger LSD1-type n=1 Tax=Arabidopsis thaliana x Arabidopsis arenosa TaxID=1240361 RepID=A0A8T1YA29_9BRAS|nr:Zinc finger LSD1-type [Arabidopsis thaliana x Arabidopsis arenosa]